MQNKWHYNEILWHLFLCFETYFMYKMCGLQQHEMTHVNILKY